MTKAKGKRQAKFVVVVKPQMSIEEMFRKYPASQGNVEEGTEFWIKQGETPERARQIAFETVRADVAEGEYDESTVVLERERKLNGTPFTLRRTIKLHDGSIIKTQGYCSSITYVNDNEPDTVYCLRCNEHTMLVPGVNYDPNRPYRCKRDKNTPEGFFGSTHDILVWCREHQQWEELK